MQQPGIESQGPGGPRPGAYGPRSGPSTISLVMGNSDTSLYGADDWILRILDKELRYPTSVARQLEATTFTPAVPGAWDGWVRLLRWPKSSPPSFPSGLLETVQRQLRKWGVPFAVEDARTRPDMGFPDHPKHPVIDRGYQLACEKVALETGRGVLDMPPRSGKTRVMISIVAKLALPTLWIAPTDAIVRQTLAAIKEFIGPHYAVHQSGSKNLEKAKHARVVLCTAATAVRLAPELYDTRAALVVDEWHHCLSGATAILTDTGWRRIDALSVGSRVLSCCGTTPQWKRITRVWNRTAPTTMLRITTSVGVLEVTSEHKIYTPSGKVKAGDLRAGSIVRVLKMPQSDQTRGTLQSTRSVVSRARYWKTALYQMWRRVQQAVFRGASDDVLGKEFDDESRDAQGCDVQTIPESGIPEASFGTNEGRCQSRQEARSKSQDARWDQASNPEGNDTIWAGHRGQREGYDAIRNESVGGFAAPRVRGGVQNTDRPKTRRWRDMVLFGFRAIEKEVGCRSRRYQSPEQARGRRPQRRLAAEQWVGRDSDPSGIGFEARFSTYSSYVEGRVLSIEVFKATCDSVFDLEIADNHNYVAEGILVSNSAAKTYREIMKLCDHIYYRFGMTGTFFRSGDDAMAMHALLSNTIYRVTASELVDQNYLVPGRVVYIPVDAPRLQCPTDDARIVPQLKYGIQEHDYRNQLVAYAASYLNKLGRKVLVLVSTKEQGRRLQRMIASQVRPRADGAQFEPVEFLSTDRHRNTQQQILKAYNESQEVEVLLGTSLVGEGVDLPPADALVYARGEKAEVTLAQNSFRPLTAVHPKKYAIIVDFADRHNKMLLRHSKQRLSFFHCEPIFSVEVLPSIKNLGSWLRSLP